ncbi:MAG: DUF255 domain-containing protein [Caldithrix sp.]|nr:DUF255 domain-containing protein [Caldithrix sp.]
MTDKSKKNTNQLINETSPYLLQHAHNPVDWYPWNAEALEKSRKDDKPILLSVGYAACHWCHVMEKESFENEHIATIMNEQFVNIKVDREERPDIDQLYMTFVQMYTGGGGWPMTVFLTPDQKPFFGGTYFPPQDRYGRPGFERILKTVANFYHQEKDKLHQTLTQVDAAYKQIMDEHGEGAEVNQDTLTQSVARLETMYDANNGGIGQAPKFPAVQVFNLFLRLYKSSGQEKYRDMVLLTLNKMADGGIYDQLGGGFSRYSVDEQWLVPHFEKMLYDNAQLVQLYLDGYLVSGNTRYLHVAQETLDFVQRELMTTDGGFMSSIDADSEGVEGKFYVWDQKEIFDLLGEMNGKIFCQRYGITAGGNFEGKNILHISKDWKSLARTFGYSPDELMDIINRGKKVLFEQRKKRIRPKTDTKIIVSWNGLMLSAFARAFQITRKNTYKNTITKHITFLYHTFQVDGRLLHVYGKGKTKHDAYLDDYANLINGLLDAYEALFDASYLKWALELTETVNQEFWDNRGNGYFYTSKDQQQLLHRMKDEGDQSLPSASGVMLLNMLRLYSVTENDKYIEKSEQLFQKYGGQFTRNPFAYASYLNALDFYLQKPREILLVSPDDTHLPEHWLDILYNSYRPNKVVLHHADGEQNPHITASFSKNRSTVDKQLTAYVCHNFSCSLPVTSVKELSRLLP